MIKASACARSWPREIRENLGGVYWNRYSTGRGCGCVLCVWCLCGACCGAWCCLSPVPLVTPSLVLRCGVVLAACLPCFLPCLRPLLGCWLSPVSFVASSLFTLSSPLRWLVLLPGMHFLPASALVCVSVFLLACSFFSLVGPCLLCSWHALGTGYARKSGEPLGFGPKEGTCGSTGAHPPVVTSASCRR